METKTEQQTHHIVAAKAQLATLRVYNKRLHQRLANAASALGSADVSMQGPDAVSGSFLKSFPLQSERSFSSSLDFGTSLASPSRQKATQGTSQGAVPMDTQPPPFPISERTELVVEAPRSTRPERMGSAQIAHLDVTHTEASGVGIYASYEAPDRNLASMSYSVGITYKNLLDAANAAPSRTARVSSTGGDVQEEGPREQESLMVRNCSPYQLPNYSSILHLLSCLLPLKTILTRGQPERYVQAVF